MQESKITLRNPEGERLAGVVAQGEKAALLLVHGFHETKHENGWFDEMAAHLAAAGYAVHRFDFSGCGESEGDYSGTALSKLKADLKVMLRYVKEQSDRVGIIAQSFGTAVAVALEPEVDALVLMGSIAHPQEIIASLFGDGYQPDGISRRKRSDGRITSMGPQFWPDAANDILPGLKAGVSS